MKVRELFTDESKWTKGELARNKYGERVSEPSDNSAVCWCLSGAVFKCYPDERDYNDIRNRIRKEIRYDIARWNDDYRTTFEEVKELVEKLDI